MLEKFPAYWYRYVTSRFNPRLLVVFAVTHTKPSTLDSSTAVLFGPAMRFLLGEAYRLLCSFAELEMCTCTFATCPSSARCVTFAKTILSSGVGRNKMLGVVLLS